MKLSEKNKFVAFKGKHPARSKTVINENLPEQVTSFE